MSGDPYGGPSLEFSGDPNPRIELGEFVDEGMLRDEMRDPAVSAKDTDVLV